MNPHGPVIDQCGVAKRMERLLHKVDGCEEIKSRAVIAFKDTIENDPELYMRFHKNFDGAPQYDARGRLQVRDYLTMLQCFDKIIEQAPAHDSNFLVSLPFTTILHWWMSTPDGFTLLMDRRVNDHFRLIFAEWSKYLVSPKSASVLNRGPEGWLGKDAMCNMPGFVDLFECDPQQRHWGFTCWDDFFSRRLRPNARPVEHPADSTYITSACESTVLRCSYDVRDRDKFWLKDVLPYSLTHMLAADPLANYFIGGTVYQAFLSHYYYHRWHAPVSGTIVKAYVVPGTYFAVLSDPDAPSKPDLTAFYEQQPFFTHVATRAIIFILADDPRIGLMCFLAVGMAEVSSCEIMVRPGDHVSKGDGMGTFHFGGSTHALVFGPQVKLEFLKEPGEFVEVRSSIARLVVD
ncbi:PSDC domain-containing protein [Mycena chlorophos]|uniref:PSDC domain-containing protein n=1 Tax=Mycena chlorophos TaxID=658473 RepID=A0A8H6TI01_MYCCL|nr:PSDC domain-containing protein [Mycena chlorophos]